ncbi:MAG: hypothetical protein KatS3mg087_1775 [Patescibacteria group bacterium]|nr:MAG: hypothetical protein KatS3mg087_1775 [Patescibacteria group bacterium]
MNDFPAVEILFGFASVLFLLLSVALLLVIDEALDKRRKRALHEAMERLQFSLGYIRHMIDEPEDLSVRVADAILARVGLSEVSPEQIVSFGESLSGRIEQVAEKIKDNISDDIDAT